jgi:dihydroorotate dehydrogenase
MYKSLIRPLLFLLSPETVHHLVVFLIKCLVFIPGMKSLSASWFSYSGKKSGCTVAGLHFSNRVGMAAGFDKNADFYEDFTLFGFSFIEIGTVTPLAQSGNPKPRLFRLPADKALINRMGFNNKGVEYAAKKLRDRNKSIIIGGNIGKNTTTPNEKAPADYLTCFTALYDVVDYLVVNVSCPNINGLDKLQDKDSLREILDILMKERKSRAVNKPVFLKISPDLSFRSIDETIALCQESGLDGIIATNTTKLREG